MSIKTRPGKVIETISVFYKKQPTYNPQMQIHTGKPRHNHVTEKGKAVLLGGLIADNKRTLGYTDKGTRYPLQIVKFIRERVPPRIHPTQKPLALLEYLIKTYSNPNNIILDNTSGSGTTLLAAQNLGRQYIGIEKDPDHYWKARRRLGDLCPMVI